MFDDFDTQITPEEFEDDFIEDEDLYGYDLEYNDKEVEYEQKYDFADYGDGTAIAYGIALLQTLLNKKKR